MIKREIYSSSPASGIGMDLKLASSHAMIRKVRSLDCVHFPGVEVKGSWESSQSRMAAFRVIQENKASRFSSNAQRYVNIIHLFLLEASLKN